MLHVEIFMMAAAAAAAAASPWTHRGFGLVG
jgi:hypothetical protein